MRGKGEGGRESGFKCGDGDSSGGEESVVVQGAVFDEVYVGLGRGRDFPAPGALDDRPAWERGWAFGYSVVETF